MDIKQISLPLAVHREPFINVQEIKLTFSRYFTYGFFPLAKRFIATILIKVNKYFRKTKAIVLHLKNIFRRNARNEEQNIPSSNFSYMKPQRRFPIQKVKKLLKPLALLIVIALAIYGAKIVSSNASSTKAEEPQVAGAKATTTIDKEIEFPLKDGDGEEVSRIKYKLEKAELRDEIIAKGQKAVAADGRTFLIITVKITNDFNDSISMNTRNYVRLSVNGNQNEWLAPNIHNDPVEVQPISTQFTRIGFTVNNSDTGLVLRVGEIEGDKETIDLNF